MFVTYGQGINHSNTISKVFIIMVGLRKHWAWT